MTYRELTMRGFISAIKDASNGARAHKFCFVLGAGASLESGIKTGQQLVAEWDKDLTDHLPPLKYDAWKKALGITGANKTEHYSEYYAKRFENEPDFARNYMEQLMEGKRPSCGYVILSHVLSKTQHNIIITTNFDHLSEDAVGYYAQQMPLVLGHEALATHFSDKLSRPIIIKIHRDLLLDPASDPDAIKRLSDEWRQVLDKVFRAYHPIFIGYAGNDPSLMGFLHEATPLFNNKTYLTPFWLLFRESEPCGSIADFLDMANGVFVSHEGFDSTMVLIGQALGYRKPSKEEFLADCEERYTLLTEALDKFMEEQKKRDQEREERRKSDETHVTDALEDIAGISKQETPQRFLRNIWSQPYDKQIIMMEDAMRRFPSNAWVLGTYALVEEEHGQHDKAQLLYEKVVALEPTDARNLGNYAKFHCIVRKDYDTAEAYYRRAIEADPNHVSSLGNFALFLDDVRKDYDTAEAYYKRAIEADPNQAINLGNYAHLLFYARKDYDTSETYYKRAIEAAPNRANNLGNYANLLYTVRKDYDSAEAYYKRAIEAGPNQATNLGNYAYFLHYVRKDYDTAKAYYKRAIEADPNHAMNLGNFALFLHDVCKDYDMAEAYYKRAIEANPSLVNNLGNYATLLYTVRKDFDAAEAYYRRAIEADPSHANNLGNFAFFLQDVRKDYDTAEVYYKRAIEANPNNAIILDSYAEFLKNIRKDLAAAGTYREEAESIKRSSV